MIYFITHFTIIYQMWAELFVKRCLLVSFPYFTVRIC